MVTLVIILVILLLVSAFLSASETAVFSLSSMKVKDLKEKKDPRGNLVARMLSHPKQLMVTILIMNVLISVLVQNIVSGIFGTFSTYLLNVGVPLALTLIIGDVIPKTIALSKNYEISLAIAPILNGLQIALTPIRVVITKITSWVSKISFFYLKKEADISHDELKHALRASKEFGILNETEAKLVRGFLNLEDDIVKEIMRPRGEVIYYDIHEPLEILVGYLVDKECTQVPVCDGSLEKVLGIMNTGIFFMHQEHIQTPMDLLPFLKKCHFIPEAMVGKSLLRNFYEKEENFMFVIDEYGSISGIITLEDVVEVIVGQIADKRDEKSLYSRSGNDVIICSGKLELHVIEDLFDVHMETPNNMATIGGYLTEQMGDIPKSGAKLVTEDFLFHILAADPKRIRRVYIRYLRGKSVEGKE